MPEKLSKDKASVAAHESTDDSRFLTRSEEESLMIGDLTNSGNWTNALDDSVSSGGSGAFKSTDASGKSIDTSGTISARGNNSLIDDSISVSARSSYSWEKRSSHSSDKDKLSTSIRTSQLLGNQLNLMDSSSAKQRKSREALAALTINKLNTSKIGMIGREKEIAILHSCYNRMMDGQDGKTSIRELVFIKGWSGAGKSMLAKTLKEKVSFIENECIVEGKFDLNSSNVEPYSGIAEAFGDMFSIIMNDPERKDSAQIALNIKDALGEDLQMMMYLIPELVQLVGDYSEVEISDEDAYVPEDAQQRWKYAFRMMARAVTAAFKGMVMILDDLQWSDMGSLDVIEYLISDVENHNPLMIVGSYRSNEVDEESVLHKRIQSLLAMCDKCSFKITEIDVPRFDVADVNKMIMAMLSIDDEETTKDLAEVCFKRTGGNPFFLLEFMTLLYEEGLVEFNLGLMKWRWNASKIEEMTMSTSNVVGVLQTRMRKLGLDSQYLLQYAACLGASFTISNLQLVWKEDKKSDGQRLTVADFLAVAKKEGLIESIDESEYRWVHDKVQEAALYLSDNVNDSFQFDIGITLLRGLTPEEVENKLFDIVDLINNGKVKRGEEFARLNLRAAEKARAVSAFQSASAYASSGIRFLPSNSWEVDAQLALKLYTMAAEMELALGRVESCEEFVEEALSQPNVLVMESLQIRIVKVRTLCSTKLKYDEAINYCLSLLRQLGSNLTWTRKTVPLQAIMSLSRSVKALKQAPQEVLQNLSKSQDSKENSIAQIVDILHYVAYMSKDVFLSILCSTRLVEMTLKSGVNPFSAGAIATVGSAVRMVSQDYETCDKFCELSHELERRFKGSRISMTIAIASGFGLCWTRLLVESLKPAMEGYKLGMQKGTVEFACWNLVQFYVSVPYVMGKSLETTVEEFPKVLAQLENVAQSEHIVNLRLWWQLMVLHLRGGKDSGNQLEGEIFDRSRVSNEESKMYRGTKHLCEGELLLFGSDYEAAAERHLKHGNLYEKERPAFFLIMIETFHRAVALYAMAHKKKGSRKYKAPAEKIRKTIRKWKESGNPNVTYYVTFLDAEHYALSKSKLDEAEENYRQAIVFAARSGHLHHSGLFSERYADFLLSKRKDVTEAKYRFGEAIRYFEEWGAAGKVQQLRELVNRLP